MLNLYEKLQASPLFNGLTSDNLTQIIGQTRFSFSKYEPRQIIKKEGDACRELTLLINGTLTRKTAADDRSYSVEETEEAPYVMQPERFFGLTQSYSSDFTAMTVCDTLSISKDDVMRLSDEFIIFRLNLVGIVSTVAQKAQTKRMAHIQGRHTRKDYRVSAIAHHKAKRTKDRTHKDDKAGK